jgi:hypothetical protein
MNNQFTFTNKEEYLAYRSNWKAEYKELSNTIRQIKSDIRMTQKNREYAGRMQYTLIKERKAAASMLEDLKLSKAEAQRQYLEQKQSLQAVSV